MTIPTKEELASGNEGMVWAARRGEQKLEVKWMGQHAKYLCRIYLQDEDEESPHEARVFDYPHEVVDWLSLWFQNMGPFQATP